MIHVPWVARDLVDEFKQARASADQYRSEPVPINSDQRSAISDLPRQRKAEGGL